MPNPVIIVDKITDYRWPDPEGRVVTADTFLAGDGGLRRRPGRVINLCRDFEYLDTGYYCSLVAAARGDRVVPDVETLLDLQQRRLHAGRLAQLDRTLAEIAGLPAAIRSFTVAVFFGRAADQAFATLAERSFELFRSPLLEIAIERRDGDDAWTVSALRPLDPRDIAPAQDVVFLAALDAFTRRNWRPGRTESVPRMDLAVLHDPADTMPPSRLDTLHHLARVGEDMGIAVELIQRRDFARLTQFDALFIRETTAIPHHTFRFARKAAAAGMPVIDDPASILRCTNKAYLAELLRGHGVPTPATRMITRRTLGAIEADLAFPAVLKIPDGSFSRGVKRARDRQEFRAIAELMLKESEVILVQEYMYTEFDWRVGVLAGEPLFVARYYMCDQHWQILRHDADGSHAEGRTQAFALADVPREVLEAATRSARLIGDGFYGVDIKQRPDGVFVIEVNDNPNLDRGLEDGILGDELYRRLLRRFLHLVDARHQPEVPVFRKARGLALPPVAPAGIAAMVN